MRTDVKIVSVRVNVPVDTTDEAVTDMVLRMLNTAQYECEELNDRGENTDCSDLAVKSEFKVSPNVRYGGTEGTDLECKVYVDEATYVGDEDDGVYYQVWEDDDGSFWMSAIVDCDTGGFVDSLVDTDGPYDTREAAESAGRDAAEEWCAFNEVDYS